MTLAGVMSLDFHPEQASILAIGLHNGNIEVHNVMARDSTHPLYKTSAAAGKHLDAVTAIRWVAARWDILQAFHDGTCICPGGLHHTCPRHHAPVLAATCPAVGQAYHCLAVKGDSDVTQLTASAESRLPVGTPLHLAERYS